MTAAHIDFEPHVYQRVQHAFFNDENPLRYDEAAAAEAWKLSLEFLREAFQ